MFVGRERGLSLALGRLKESLSVDVIGDRGSGRSAFIRVLEERLVAEDRHVTFIQGIASLKDQPLAALQLTGLESGKGSTRPPMSFSEAASHLHGRLDSSRAVILVDDWEDLDEASWGVIETVRRVTGTPFALTKLKGTSARQTPSGLSSASGEPTLVLETQPLRFEELEMVLADRLEGPIETGTMNRIYSKTGGNVGLALAMVDSAVREGRLGRHGDQPWSSAGVLWTPGMRAVLETQLIGLTPAARDGVEIIAMLGAADIETVRKLVAWESLELLEANSLIAFVSSTNGTLVTVIPPLLVEYFRHEPTGARRIRLSELILQRIGAGPSEAAALDRWLSPNSGDLDNGALLPALIRERARSRRFEAGAEWELIPSPANATEYIRALLQSSAGAVTSTVDHVFAQTDSSIGDAEARAWFVTLHAQWLAYAKHQLDEALVVLRSAVPDLGPYAKIVCAVEIGILTYLETTPSDYAERLQVEADLPPSVQLTQYEIQMLVLVKLCRFAEAGRVYEEVKKLDPKGERWQTKALYGLALLHNGQYAESIRTLRNGFNEARGRLDMDASRAFGAVLASCYIHSGDYEEIDSVLNSALAIGEPVIFAPGTQLALLAVASNVASRRGNTALVERYDAEASQSWVVDGPMPAQSVSWLKAQTLVLNGNPREASDVLWEAGDALWQRQALLAAIAPMLVSLELNPQAERFSDVKRLLEEIPEATAFWAQAKYLEAVTAGDTDKLFESGKELFEGGRFGLAISALQQAEAAYLERGLSKEAEACRGFESKVRATVRSTQLDINRFSSYRMALSARETQVAKLAAAGLANAEIATQLVISVRTVESHMRRILRKLDLTGRDELRSHFDEDSAL